jgi:membrane protease YdiL (CAAX protease family)
VKYIWSLALQFLLMLLLIPKDKNDGERELFKNQNWKPWHVLILISLMNLISIFSNYFLRFEFVKDLIRIIPFASHLLYFCVLLILVKFQDQLSIQAIGFKTNKKQVLIAIVITLGWYTMLCTPLYFKKGSGILILDVVKKINNLGFTWSYAAILFHYIILGPIIEEIIFRGVLYSPYRKKYGPTVAVLLTSLFFCAFHPIRAFVVTLIDGIIFGTLYEKTESIIPPIIAHCTINFLAHITSFILLRMT